METVTISKEEYEKLKRKAQEAEIDYELVEKIRGSLEDVKHGRISQWKPKQVK